MDEFYKHSIFLGLFFIVILAFSIVMNNILLKFSTNLGTRGTSDSMIRWNAQSKPALGGISFYIIFLMSMVFEILIISGTTLNYNKELLIFLGVCSLGFIMGLSDDAYNTTPLLKFSVQLACGLLFIYSGNYIKIFPNEWLNYFFTILWVVGLMNSINMLDNMDGVTTLVSIGITAGAIFYMILADNTNNVYFITSLGVLAGLIGFLKFNWYPSKMFMGDTGSQFLGVFLAWIGIMFFWNSKDVDHQPIQTKQILTAILVFIAPIADTATVSVNRILAGKSPFVGGRDHTTHNLVYNGFTERQVAAFFAALTCAMVLITVNFIFFVHNWTVSHAVIGFVIFTLICLILYSTTKTKKARAKIGK